MRQQLTYVPASQPGPHYVEAGKRPLIDLALVICQTTEGDIRPLNYVHSRDVFIARESGAEYFVVCWWHLPQPVPATEREWFEATFTDSFPGTASFKESTLGYKAARERSDPDEWHGMHDSTGHAFLYRKAHNGPRDYASLIDAMYNHWVAAGRP